MFTRPPLADWLEFRELLCAPEWPPVETLNRFAQARRSDAPRFVAQAAPLLADGLHYEQRICSRGEIATRERNWHDLLNALIWLRYPRLKAALNARQVGQIAIAGPKSRTRPQCALTLFDEAGVAVSLRDPALLALWDAHDWHGLFWRQRSAWGDGRIEAVVFGHAILEHALKPRQLLVGKALVVRSFRNAKVDNAASLRADHAVDAIAGAIAAGDLLIDPQELRPLPLSGIPGWHADNTGERFYLDAPCFRPLRSGRRYPAPLSAETRHAARRVVAEKPGFRAVAAAGAVIAGDAKAAAVADAAVSEGKQRQDSPRVVQRGGRRLSGPV